MLETRNLACQRGDRELFRALALAVAPGQLLRVAGANGSGKTSLLRLLTGLAHPSEGEVCWRSVAIAGQREAFARELFYLGHLAGLKDDLSPLENLRADAALSGQAASDASLRQALCDWGLARALDLPARLLSAGQRRRAALARLTLSDATLWILDEPFNALDSDAVAYLGGQLERHLHRGGLAVVTSHQALPLAGEHIHSLQLGA